MIAKIKLLNNNLINKIAAGEVVERPKSVVKELVENAIDAGAGIITIEINDSLIRVSDNGNGIPHDQVETAFMRHATSKIENTSDLANILTLGFRGEAMSSIASVSKTEMVTRHITEEMGTYIQISGGELQKKQSVGATYGTSVIVRNLFYNVPARQKFLKKPSIEVGYITDLVQKFVLANTNITFNYILNGNKYHYGNNNLKTTIYQIYGKSYYNDLIQINHTEDSEDINDNLITNWLVKINGFITKPSSYRPNRAFGNFFINGRYIKSRLLQTAVEEAYNTKLPIGKFPVYVINVSVNPSVVDVNVHPIKLEVRFQNEDYIYNIIRNVVSKVLKQNIIIPTVSIVKESKKEKEEEDKKEESEDLPFKVKTFAKQVFEDEHFYNPSKPKLRIASESNSSSNKYEKKDTLSQENIKKLTNNINTKSSQLKVLSILEDEEVKSLPFIKNYKIIGLFFNTYWAIEHSGNVYLIDQHAAHERIIYDDLIKKIKECKPISQELLAPVPLTLTSTEDAIYNDNIEYFTSLGFEVQSLGYMSYAIRAVPFIFGNGINASTFLEILVSIQNKTIKESINNEKLASIACKAAVKGGDVLDKLEAVSLINMLDVTQNPFTCPHGRPTIVKLTKNEVEKMFKRVM